MSREFIGALLQLNADGIPDFASGHPVYTMRKGDYPYVVLHLDYPANDLRIDIFRVGWRGFLTPIAPNYRSWVKTGPTGKDGDGANYYEFYRFAGTYTTLGATGKQYPIANGTYVIVITVAKALSSGHSPGDYETWTSPTFSIAHHT